MIWLALPFTSKNRWTFPIASPIVVDGCTERDQADLKQDASIEAVRQLLAGKEYETRAADRSVDISASLMPAIARKRRGCVKALRQLEQARHIVLTAAAVRSRAHGGLIKPCLLRSTSLRRPAMFAR